MLGDDVHPATPHPPENIPLGIACRLVAVVAFAVMFALAKLAAQDGANTIEILFWRQLIAVPIVLGWIAAGPGIGVLRTARPGAHVRRMVVGITAMGFNFASYIALPVAEATTLGFAIPLVATALAALWLKERVGIHRWSAVLAGFVGILIVVQPGGTHLDRLGLAYAAASVALTGWVTVLIRDLSRSEDPAAIVFWFMVNSLAPMGLLMLWFGHWHDGHVGWLLLAVGIAGAIGQLAMTFSLRLAPVSVVMPFDYASLLFAALIGLWLFGTVPAASTWAGAPLIVGSGLYIAWREHRLRRMNAR